jgi:hypothetical protein
MLPSQSLTPTLPPPPPPQVDAQGRILSANEVPLCPTGLLFGVDANALRVGAPSGAAAWGAVRGMYVCTKYPNNTIAI